MTLPTRYTWFAVGQRLRVAYEAAQGRRVNVLGALFTHGPQAGRFLHQSWASLPKPRNRKSERRNKGQNLCQKVRKIQKARKTPAELAATHALTPEQVGPIDGARLVSFIWHLAGRPAEGAEDWRRSRPLVIVLDNYSVHKGQTVKDVLPAWTAADVHLLYLPSYCPELSQIEPVWNDVKGHRLPVRSYAQVADCKRAVEAALVSKAEQLQRNWPKTKDFQQGTT